MAELELEELDGPDDADEPDDSEEPDDADEPDEADESDVPELKLEVSELSIGTTASRANNKLDAGSS